jgi:hypothetical protein
MVNRLRGEQARAADDNARLTQEIDVLRARLADSDGVTSDLAALRGERELIRTRVTDMLDQLEHLNL